MQTKQSEIFLSQSFCVYLNWAGPGNLIMLVQASRQTDMLELVGGVAIQGHKRLKKWQEFWRIASCIDVLEIDAHGEGKSLRG